MLPARPLASWISRYANNPSQLNMKTIIMDATGALTLIRIYTHGIRMMRHHPIYRKMHMQTYARRIVVVPASQQRTTRQP
jgi:hypothetical protein